MARALTQKQEAFALAAVDPGVANLSDAYRLVYNAERMTDAAVWVEASRLASHPTVSLRIAELRAVIARRTSVTAERVVAEYARIAFADMRRFATVKNGSVVLTDSDEWTDDDAAAGSEGGG